MGFPVTRSQTIVVSRWFVIPIAATSSGRTAYFSKTSRETPLIELQMSIGSCSTQPGFGKICGNSF